MSIPDNEIDWHDMPSPYDITAMDQARAAIFNNCLTLDGLYARRQALLNYRKFNMEGSMDAVIADEHSDPEFDKYLANIDLAISIAEDTQERVQRIVGINSFLKTIE